jgi:NitT/TauT family transport system substrate-binding protein
MRLQIQRLLRRSILLRVGFLAAMLIALISTYMGCAKAPDGKVRVSVNSWPGFGPLYVAQERGFFERNGLEVQIIRMEDSADRRAALIAGRIDVLASTLDDLAVALSQDIPAAAFSCADYSNGGDGIIVAEDINSLADLIRTRVAVQPGFVNHFFLLYALHKEGVDASQVRLSPMRPDDAGAAFIAGSIDAAVTWEPHLSEGVERRRGSKVLVRSSQYPEAILDLFVANPIWLDEEPQQVAAFRQAWDEAVEHVRKQPADAHLIISRHTGIEPAEVSAMLEGAQLLTNEECAEFLRGRLDSLAPTVEQLWREAGYVEGTIDLRSAVRLD